MPAAMVLTAGRRRYVSALPE